jgi:catechol 2,3-dioxygenase-like lactoylglutathione lyase family enzyme
MLKRHKKPSQKETMIDHINAYVLSVSDLDSCIAFYRDKMGFKLKDKMDDFAYLVFGNSGPGIGLVSVESAEKMISPETGIRSKDAGTRTDWNYFAVFVEDVDKEYQELREKGVHFLKEPTTHPWGQRIAYFEDPEGNVWEISTFLKKQ